MPAEPEVHAVHDAPYVVFQQVAQPPGPVLPHGPDVLGLLQTRSAAW
jgi:hypothetical protein